MTMIIVLMFIASLIVHYLAKATLLLATSQVIVIITRAGNLGESTGFDLAEPTLGQGKIGSNWAGPNLHQGYYFVGPTQPYTEPTGYQASPALCVKKKLNSKRKLEKMKRGTEDWVFSRDVILSIYLATWFISSPFK